MGRGLARDWKLEIDTGTDEAPVWIPVKGLKEIKLTVDPTEADSTDLDDGVWGSKTITGRDWNITCSGAVTFTKDAQGERVYDPGQVYLQELGFEAGDDAVVRVRRTRRLDGKGRIGYANVSIKESGGGRTDLDPFNVEFSGAGPLEPVTVTSP